MKKVRFFDFDGTLMDTPMPDIGKLMWKKKKGTDYPHIGWWGRLESVDSEVFDIQPKPQVLDIYNSGKDEYVLDYILTSRMPKFKSAISELLEKHNIKMLDIFLASSLDKGQRIVKFIEDSLNYIDISVIEFYDDRDKEIIAVENVRHIIENQYDIKLVVVKIDSDNHD